MDLLSYPVGIIDDDDKRKVCGRGGEKTRVDGGGEEEDGEEELSRDRRFEFVDLHESREFFSRNSLAWK